MNPNIAIIGAGQLGSRHLQALALLDTPAHIWVVDPSGASRTTAEARWNEVPAAAAHTVSFVADISGLPQIIDVAIIATSSLVRRAITEALLEHAFVRYLVLEKVLFPALEDYAAVEKLLAEKGTRAWVNCPRRQYPGYQQLQKEVNAESLLMTVWGSGWGLACNSIHWIDAFAYLSGDTRIEITESLDAAPFFSKRAGYTEFSGTLLVTNQTGSRLLIHCFAAGVHPLQARVETTGASFHIEEAKQQVTVRRQAANWEAETEAFPVLRQSLLSHLFTSHLLQTGSCDLTPYAESMRLHLPLLRIFLEKYNQFHQTPQNTLCPIT